MTQARIFCEIALLVLAAAQEFPPCVQSSCSSVCGQVDSSPATASHVACDVFAWTQQKNCEQFCKQISGGQLSCAEGWDANNNDCTPVGGPIGCYRNYADQKCRCFNPDATGWDCYRIVQEAWDNVGPCHGVTCTVQDQCHTLGSCTDGTCSNPTKPDGSACNDGDSGTSSDICTNGVCAGTHPCDGVTCTALDDCHDAGVCTGGTCSDPNNADGTACDDGDAYTTNDACTNGVCAGTDPCAGVTCTAQDQCHDAGVCTGGTCSNPDKADGASCSDGDSFTVNDACASAVCSGTGCGFQDYSGNHCFGLGASSAQSAEACKEACCNDSSCNVYQWMEDNTCWIGDWDSETCVNRVDGYVVQSETDGCNMNDYSDKHCYGLDQNADAGDAQSGAECEEACCYDPSCSVYQWYDDNSCWVGLKDFGDITCQDRTDGYVLQSRRRG